MSMYNMLLGRNPACPFLLAMLGLTPEDTGRLRDCLLFRSGKELIIYLFTRNGGPNREEYENVTNALRALPWYIDDADEALDGTYASYRFRIPEEHRATAEGLTKLGAEEFILPMEKLSNFLSNLKSGDRADSVVEKVMNIGREILTSFERGHL